MEEQSYELAIEELKNLLSEKEELNGVANSKIEVLIVELKLQGCYPHPIDPAEQRILNGFTYFKLNNFKVSPSIILNFQPGEAFMIQSIANMVPSFNQLRYRGVGPTIEYAIKALKVENILVIGHSRCGGISRLMSHPEDGSAPYDFIDDWVKIGLPFLSKPMTWLSKSLNGGFKL